MLLPVNNGLLLSEPTCKSNKPFSIINKSSTGEGGIAEAEASGGVIGPGLLISDLPALSIASNSALLNPDPKLLLVVLTVLMVLMVGFQQPWKPSPDPASCAVVQDS